MDARTSFALKTHNRQEVLVAPLPSLKLEHSMSKTTPKRDPEQDALDARMLARILAFAENVEGVAPPEDDEGIDPAVLAHEHEQRTWFSGMFIYASTIVVDELFADIATLHASGNPTVDLRDTQQLSALPPHFVGHYTALFAQRLLVSTTDVTQQFVQGWVHLRSSSF